MARQPLSGDIFWMSLNNWGSKYVPLNHNEKKKWKKNEKKTLV